MNTYLTQWGRDALAGVIAASRNLLDRIEADLVGQSPAGQTTEVLITGAPVDFRRLIREDPGTALAGLSSPAVAPAPVQPEPEPAPQKPRGSGRRQPQLQTGPAEIETMTAAEAAAHLEVDYSLVAHLCRSGALLAWKKGPGRTSPWVISAESVRNYSAQKKPARMEVSSDTSIPPEDTSTPPGDTSNPELPAPVPIEVTLSESRTPFLPEPPVEEPVNRLFHEPPAPRRKEFNPMAVADRFARAAAIAGHKGEDGAQTQLECSFGEAAAVAELVRRLLPGWSVGVEPKGQYVILSALAPAEERAA